LNEMGLHSNLLKKSAVSFCCIILFSVTQSLWAEVVTDGSVGPAQSLSGPDYLVADNIGTTVGQNLFHSFQAFSIFQGESATFTGPDHIANVISRVTGGGESMIDGILRSRVGQADFFFINPDGIVFGENAQIDVPGAFHAGTADELRFGDGAVFSASDPDASALSIAQPEAFGFLSPQTASIELNGAQLEFAEGSTVSLSSGDITIRGLKDGEELSCEGGRISLTAMGDQSGEVALDGEPSVKAGGRLYIESAEITTSGNGGGNIAVRAGEAKLTNAYLLANNTGESDAAGGVDIAMDGLLTMDTGAFISSTANSSGNAGNVSIKAGELQMKVGSAVSCEAYESSKGHAGNLKVRVDGLLTMDTGAFISSATKSLGDAGDVFIHAGELHMGVGSWVKTDAYESSKEGRAGNLKVRVDGLLAMHTGALISSATHSLGDAGKVSIKAGELQMENGSWVRSNAVESAGQAGTVEVSVYGRLAMRNSAHISSDTHSSGNAGSVIVDAGELQMEGRSWISSDANNSSKGRAGNLAVSVDGLLAMHNEAYISSDAYSSGNAGIVIIDAGELQMKGGSRFSSCTRSSGNAGSVIIDAGELQMEGYSRVSSDTRSSGNAGIVIIDAGELRMKGGSWVSSDTYLSGNAGRVIIDAGELQMEGRSRVRSHTYSSGNAGRVIIDAGELQMGGGSWIGSDTNWLGNAGSVIINADGLKLEDSCITSTALPKSQGYIGDITINSGAITLLNGSQINIKARQTLSEDRLSDMPDHSINISTGQLNLDQNSHITAESDGNVPAGAINVRADNLVLENSSSLTTASANADAGPITLKGDNIIVRDGYITTSAGESSGNGGDITLTGLDAGPADVLVLQGGFIQANAEAPGASGGDILIDTKAVIAEGGELDVGDPERWEFQACSGLNVIQAAAPGGEHGTVDLTAPELDIAASLVDLSTGFAAPIRLATDYCQALGGQQASSLAWVGRGGLPMEQDSPWVVPFGADRLDRLLRFHGDKAPEKRKKQDWSVD
jgi:filamentous hemagglutinin family protein